MSSSWHLASVVVLAFCAASCASAHISTQYLLKYVQLVPGQIQDVRQLQKQTAMGAVLFLGLTMFFIFGAQVR